MLKSDAGSRGGHDRAVIDEVQMVEEEEEPFLGFSDTLDAYSDDEDVAKSSEDGGQINLVRHMTEEARTTAQVTEENTAVQISNTPVLVAVRYVGGCRVFQKTARPGRVGKRGRGDVFSDQHTQGVSGDTGVP
ncbi:hypothetical protein ZIOFF_064599 [Zingiber officinale]|uniref:Uncharacterized protein n=1 Tax=Zingiber officinale TaxID=94328 RepID=A0A8J5KAJ6_ZINOF|nr:hypothetical protein ZIOFF_064599 [Zingiber officinale]